MALPVHALTVDVEDWYQGIEIEPEQWGACQSRIDDSLRRLLDLCDESGTKGTFFVLGWLAEKRPDLVKLIASRGHEIGSHGYSHRLIYKLTPEQFAEELSRSIALLEDLTGSPIKSHRAAFFSITKNSLWALDILLEKGITLDSSIFPVHNYRYGIPDAPRHPYRYEKNRRSLTEFPITTLSFAGKNLPFAGGFYLRFFPYPFLKYAFGKVAKAGHSAVLYIHPWEIDPEHPRLPLPKRIALPHYHNLRSTEGKLRRLLKAYSFAPLSEVAKGVGE
jgi:polysaccharide deacetylase family protein (PEP-CTERM system associated)